MSVSGLNKPNLQILCILLMFSPLLFQFLLSPQPLLISCCVIYIAAWDLVRLPHLVRVSSHVTSACPTGWFYWDWFTHYSLVTLFCSVSWTGAFSEQFYCSFFCFFLTVFIFFDDLGWHVLRRIPFGYHLTQFQPMSQDNEEGRGGPLRPLLY